MNRRVCAYPSSLILTVRHRRRSPLGSLYRTDRHGNRLAVHMRTPLISLDLSVYLSWVNVHYQGTGVHTATNMCVIHTTLVLCQHPHTSGGTDVQTFHSGLMQTPETESHVKSRWDTHRSRDVPMLKRTLEVQHRLKQSTTRIKLGTSLKTQENRSHWCEALTPITGHKHLKQRNKL